VGDVRTFGKYVVLKLLRKQGDSVSIYLATRQDGDGKEFELHVLNHEVSDRSAEFARFLNEFQTLEALEHPGIVRVADMGMEQNKAYYATPRSGARSIWETRAAGRKFAVPEVVGLGVQVADALEYMHRKKVIHRDLGPESVYWDEATKRVVISGFALVKNFRLTNLTARGMCTPSEMRVTPEQVNDQPYDERTDIYLLGDLLYWLLTERSALTLDFSPEKPSTYNPEVPPGLDQVLMKMLKPAPAERYQSAKDLKSALEASLRPGA
jgi:serine/threonine protein kinase